MDNKDALGSQEKLIDHNDSADIKRITIVCESGQTSKIYPLRLACCLQYKGITPQVHFYHLSSVNRNVV